LNYPSKQLNYLVIFSKSVDNEIVKKTRKIIQQSSICHRPFSRKFVQGKKRGNIQKEYQRGSTPIFNRNIYQF